MVLAHTHTHTHIHTHILTYTHAHTHTRTRTHIHTRTNTHAHTRMQPGLRNSYVALLLCAAAVVDNEFKQVSLDDYKGKYVVLFF